MSMPPDGNTLRPGRNFSVAGFGVVSVWMNMAGSWLARVQGPLAEKSYQISGVFYHQVNQGQIAPSFREGRRPDPESSDITGIRIPGSRALLANRNDVELRHGVEVFVGEMSGHQSDRYRESARRLA